MRLGVEYLRDYWERSLGLKAADAGEDPWPLDQTLLSGLRLNVLETQRYLHGARPTLEEFEAWIVERNGGEVETEALDRLRRALAGETVGPEVSLDGVEGLTEEDLAHWDEHGYVVLKGAVSLENAKAAEMAVYEYLGADPKDAESWYGKKNGHSIWVSVLRHPAFWLNRRSARMVKAFAQLWGREDLWVTVDQGGLNPPERPGWMFPGPHLHWDMTLAEPRHLAIGGILYLVDVAEEQGAFTCVPGFHKKLERWLAELPAGVDPRQAVLGHSEAKPIAAGAGDMVLWNQLLPHGSSPNRGTRPRVAQYITMFPTRAEHNPVWR